jgi:hypothetical protein
VIAAVSLEDNCFDASCFTSRSIMQYQSGIRQYVTVMNKRVRVLKVDKNAG